MAAKLGYKNKLVEVKNGMVYLFDGKLWSAPLERVVEYYLQGQGVVPEPIREIASDLYRVLLGENLIKELPANSGGRYGETTIS
ncbi:hypothetical protein [Thermococcus peptonophilus]|uniref:Uncharacterized protein n=1 Tax=Thermococcus peptonophilus TaxID=53952 RepID=A0A142CTM5_9EURY|nr:hypothetical protein [Thermococcus peptonophilus]AMQ18127.1 hypothetical protein A0127_02555 [Thermococcus peptonophilus]